MKVKSEIQLYLNIDSLPLYNFDRYLATKDNNWFIVGYDGRQKKVDIPDNVEHDIMEQYYTAIDDRNFQLKIQKWAKIDNLITKYNIVLNIITIMWEGFPNTANGAEMRLKLINELKEWRFKMPIFNSISGDRENLERIATELQGVRNQIALLQSELKTDGKSESISLYKQLAIIQMSLKLSFRLDPKVVTVSEWVEYVKLMQEKAKRN